MKKRIVFLLILLVGAVGTFYLSEEKNEVDKIVDETTEVIEQP
ncbi:hypothetical protein [Enterococcus pingfangensis]